MPFWLAGSLDNNSTLCVYETQTKRTQGEGYDTAYFIIAKGLYFQIAPQAKGRSELTLIGLVEWAFTVLQVC